MPHPTVRTWLWQLSYALLGLGFLVSIFIGVMAWGTSTFWVCAGTAAGCVVALAVLSRILNPPRSS